MTHTESQSAGQGHTTTYNSTDSYQISQLANPSASPSLLEPPPKSLVASQNRWRLGLILLSIVIILWVASGFLVSDIFESGIYRKPYLVTYLNTGTFTIYLLPSLGRLLRNSTRPKTNSESPNSPSPSSTLRKETSNALDETERLLGSESHQAGISLPTDISALDESLRPLTVKETAFLSSQFCVLWFLANVLSNASLSYTSVASSTILTSTSSFFTLIIGSLFKVETVTVQKLQALVNSIIGLSLIIYGSNNAVDPAISQNRVWLGNLMALGSAFIYGTYATLLKVKVGDYESRINMYLFFGFVGLFNIILFWPVVVLFNYWGIETFELPPTTHVWIIVLINAATTIISDFCWALSMLMTSPLVVTVGLSATIPLAIAGDMILKSRYDNITYYFGALLMVISIFRVNHLENTSNHAQQNSENDDPSTLH